MSKSKRLLFSLIAALLPLAVALFAYVGYCAYRTRTLYFYVKTNQVGWSGHVHQTDPELGLAPVPGGEGEIVLPVGKNIPVRYNQQGFRVPVDGDDSAGDRPALLFLGGSFTYGASVLAEDSYPYLVGQALGGYAMNAGVPSYGLVQMLLRARELIAAYKPDYIVVQYSPWLVERAVSPFAPTYFGKLPTPYFYDTGEGLELQPPVFMTKVFDLPVEGFRTKTINLVDFAHFVWRVGLPLFVHDDSNMLIYNIRRTLGLVPRPINDYEAVVKEVYAEIGELARANGAQMLIVILGGDHQPVEAPLNLFPPDALVVDAQAALLAQLGDSSESAYLEAYGIWRGDPPELIDRHPNEAAHRIIAGEILSAILRAKEQSLQADGLFFDYPATVSPCFWRMV